jgi:leader peptidase (prepilin peptidase)/N-methyltransferase
LAECVCAIAYVAVALRFGFSLQGLCYLLLTTLLFAAAMADLWGRLIPDRLVIIGIVGAFVFAAVLDFIPVTILNQSGIVQESWFTPFREGGGPNGEAVWRGLLNGLSIALPLLLLTLGFEKLTKRESMGGGDIKLFFMLSLYFDWKLNLLTLIVACLVGLLWALIASSVQRSVSAPNSLLREGGGRRPEVVFAPSLAIAAFLVMLWGQQALSWYLGLF